MLKTVQYLFLKKIGTVHLRTVAGHTSAEFLEIDLLVGPLIENLIKVILVRTQIACLEIVFNNFIL